MYRLCTRVQEHTHSTHRVKYIRECTYFENLYNGRASSRSWCDVVIATTDAVASNVVDAAAAAAVAAISIMDCTLYECLDFGIRLCTFTILIPCLHVLMFAGWFMSFERDLYVYFSTSQILLWGACNDCFLLLPPQLYALWENDFNVGWNKEIHQKMMMASKTTARIVRNTTRTHTHNVDNEPN